MRCQALVPPSCARSAAHSLPLPAAALITWCLDPHPALEATAGLGGLSSAQTNRAVADAAGIAFGGFLLPIAYCIAHLCMLRSLIIACMVLLHPPHVCCLRPFKPSAPAAVHPPPPGAAGRECAAASRMTRAASGKRGSGTAAGAEPTLADVTALLDRFSHALPSLVSAVAQCTASWAWCLSWTYGLRGRPAPGRIAHSCRQALLASCCRSCLIWTTRSGPSGARCSRRRRPPGCTRTCQPSWRGCRPGAYPRPSPPAPPHPTWPMLSSTSLTSGTASAGKPSLAGLACCGPAASQGPAPAPAVHASLTLVCCWAATHCVALPAASSSSLRQTALTSTLRRRTKRTCPTSSVTRGCPSQTCSSL